MLNFAIDKNVIAMQAFGEEVSTISAYKIPDSISLGEFMWLIRKKCKNLAFISLYLIRQMRTFNAEITKIVSPQRLVSMATLALHQFI
ncbi:hypothetical protein [Streptomyces sp. JV178]|uniref:hypothetical protein n=1 Tax=Streptomyces sp. JV178 TaxID=858632 RepID=UPI001180DBA1|nr:hypothetical protein [Streptomyces sp. JV178]